MIITSHFKQRVRERAMNNRRIWQALSRIGNAPLPRGNWFIRVRHFVICGDNDTVRTLKYRDSTSIRGVEIAPPLPPTSGDKSPNPNNK